MDVPPLVASRSDRPATVTALASRLDGLSWLALHGTAGCGKTQLVKLVARTCGRTTIWIPLRDTTADQAYDVVSAALWSVADTAGEYSPGSKWFAEACSRLDTGALVVLDDIPLCTALRLSDLLSALASTCHEFGVKILSTSHYKLPTSSSESLPEGAFSDIHCPPMTDDEAAEVFLAFGAPDGPQVRAMAKVCNAGAHGHPQIVRAIVQYLQEKNWQFREEDIGSILQLRPTGTLDKETLQRVLNTVEKKDSRELLYRLTVPISTFDEGRRRRSFGGRAVAAKAEGTPALYHRIMDPGREWRPTTAVAPGKETRPGESAE